jgi:hypothetical protein
VLESHRLNKKREMALQDFLADKANAAWLGGALSGGRSRSRAGVSTRYCSKIYLFPSASGGSGCFWWGPAMISRNKAKNLAVGRHADL